MTRYDDAITKMSMLLKERNVCLHSRKAHEKCYQELREYLLATNKCYSYDEARKWLREVVKKQESSAGFIAKWNYVDQLEELINTGTVLQDNLLLTKSNYQKLSESLRAELDMYIKSCEEKYTKRTNELLKIHCSKFLIFLQSHGINSVCKISCDIVCKFFEYEMPINPDERYVILSNSRLLLQYYVDMGKCEPVLPLLLEEDIHKYAILLEEDNLRAFTALQETCVCKAREVYDVIDFFVQEFENLGYKDTAKHNAAHITKCLYAFLSVNNLHYNIGIAELWYQRIESLVGSSYHAWIRIINLFDFYIQRKKFDPLKNYSFRKARDWKYPLWCSLAVNAYLDWLRRSFHSEGTIRSYKYVVYNFCDFLLQKKLNSFEELDRNLINEFLRIDLHSTVNGTSGRNSVLRQFITFLEDNNYLADRTIHGVIPAKLAHPRKIITVLSDEQISHINEYRKTCNSPIELRDAAMVMIGLKLGFRSSDVINLKLSDIDWVNKKISITQYKTKVPISLPLSVDVGNAVFRYLKYWRPECDNPHVFVRHKAPYGILSGKICSNALNRILSAVTDGSFVKFHTLRKTFATSILKNNAGIERVIDALGHQDPTTVNVYLTYDELHMRKCALSLDEMSIPMGGAAK